MEVRVANGDWRHGSILSLRVGNSRRQAPLNNSTRITFQRPIEDVRTVQVDVFTRVVSTRLLLDPEKKVYQLPGGDGIGMLELNVQSTSPQGNDPEAVGGGGSHMVSDYALGDEDRMKGAIKDATEYVDRYDLRNVLQSLFQQVIKEKPEDPFQFLQGCLLAVRPVGCRQEDTSAPKHNKSDADAAALQQAITAQASLQALLQAAEEEVAALRAQVQTAPPQREATQASPSQEEERLRMLLGAAEAEIARLTAERLESGEPQGAHIEDASGHAAQHVSESQVENSSLVAVTQEKDEMVAELQRTVGEKEALEKQLKEASALVDQQRASVDEELTRVKQALEAERHRSSSAEASLAKARADLARQTREAAFAQNREVPALAMGPTFAEANSPEVNTHMLASIVGSSYAPPVPPSTYFEPGDDDAEDAELLNKPKINPELLVTVVDCQDKSTNGTFAWVGDLGSRPLYRLLGNEPRYLYYAEVDPTWAGWWIADKMGSQDYVEWFREPHDARLPVYCSKGELGSRVLPQPFTREVVQKLALISNHHERVTIRSKLVEEFGSMVTKLEGSQRGLMSKTSPVVGIAHALEAQQRAIQLLHGQLAAETQRREAAEAHSQTMEEAFETLQLRISMQLPNVHAMPT